jgi:hypothetical protein
MLAGLIALTGVLDWVVIERYALPEPDQELVRAVLPVIDEHLELQVTRGALAAERPDLRPRWFCAERVIEIRRAGDELAVGLDVRCEEYARWGETLVTGTGGHGPQLALLSGGPDRYVVRRIEPSPFPRLPIFISLHQLDRCTE